MTTTDTDTGEETVRMLGRERNSQHRSSQDWGLWRRSQDIDHRPLHYHKPHYVHMRALSPQLCYSTLDLGLDYRWVRGGRGGSCQFILISWVVQGDVWEGQVQVQGCLHHIHQCLQQPSHLQILFIPQVSCDEAPVLLLLSVFPPRSFRHSCAFDFSGYEAEFNSELSSSSDERERESSHLLSDRLRGGVKGGVYDTLRLVRSLSSLPDITVISHHRRMNTEKVRVREGSRARPQTPDPSGEKCLLTTT